MSFWDDIPDRRYVRFADGVVIATFESDEPARVIRNDYGKPQWDFYVEGDLLLGVSSVRLMTTLKKLRPFTGKTLKLTRYGRGLDTMYQVEVIPND